VTKSSVTASRAAPPPSPYDGSACGSYAPGHQLHYRQQGGAMRSPARRTRATLVEGTLVRLVLEDGSELRWRHHDPERLSRLLQLVHHTCVVCPEAHALRVGPYWFNCATEDDAWDDCRPAAAGRR
jgi:hypothetical protein